MSQVLKDKPNGTIISPQKISLVDKYITKIDSIPKKYTKVDTLFLSNNCIESLEGIEQFQLLNVLSIANNCISSFYELNHLNQLPQLKVLNLEFNPVTQLPYYRYQVIHRVPSIRLLDQKEVTATEKSKATKILKKEETTLNLMFSNETLIAKLTRAIDDLKFNQEYRDDIIKKLNEIDPSHFEGLDANGIIELYDFPEVYTEDDRPIVYELLRKEVRKIHNIRLFGGGSMRESLQNTLPVVGKTSKKLQAANSKKRQLYESWDICYSEVLLHQQSKIASLLYDLEQEHANIVNEMGGGSYIEPERTKFLNQTKNTLNTQNKPSITNRSTDEGLRVVKQIQDEMNQLMGKSTSRMLDDFTKNYQFEDTHINNDAPLTSETLMTPKRNDHEHATTLAYTLPPKQQDPRYSPHETVQRETTQKDFNFSRKNQFSSERSYSPLPRTSKPVPEENIPLQFSSNLSLSPNNTRQVSQDNDIQQLTELEDILELKSQLRDIKLELERRKRGEETLQEINLRLRERLEEFKQKNSENIERAHREVSDYKRAVEDAKQKIRDNELALESSRSQISELEQIIESMKDGQNRGNLIDQLRDIRQQKEKLEAQLKNAQESMIENAILAEDPGKYESGNLLAVISEIISENPSYDVDSIKYFAYHPVAESFRKRMLLRRQRDRLRTIFRFWKKFVEYKKAGKVFEIVHQSSLLKTYFIEWRKKLKSRMTSKTRLDHARLYYEHKILKKSFTSWRTFRVQSLELNRVMEEEAENMNRKLILKHAFDAWKQWMEDYVYSFRQRVAAFRDYHYRRLLVNMFYRWKERYHQKVEKNRKLKRASDHHDYKTLKNMFAKWREYTQHRLRYKVQKQQAVLFHELLLLRKSLRILNATVKYNNRMKDVHIRAYDFLFQSLRRKYFNAWKIFTRNMKRDNQLQNKCNTFILRKYFITWKNVSRNVSKESRIERIADELYKKRCQKTLQKLFLSWKHSTQKRQSLNILLEHSQDRLNLVKLRFFFSTWRSRYTEKLCDTISKMNENVSLLQSETISITSNKKEYEIENLNLINKIHDLTGEISKQNITISDQSTQIQRLEYELNEAALIERSLRDEINSLNEQNNDFRDEINILKTNLVHYADVPTESLEMIIDKQNYQEQIASLKETMGVKDREIDKLRSLLVTLEGGESYQQQKLREAYDIIAQLRASLEEKDEEISSIKVQYGQNNVLVRDWRKKAENDEQEILNKNETIRNLTQKLLDAKEREKISNLTVREREEELEKLKYEMDFLTSSPEAEGEEYSHERENEVPPNTEEISTQFEEDKELRDSLLSHTLRYPTRFTNDTPLKEYPSQLPSKLISPYSSVSSLPAPVRVPDTTVYSTHDTTENDSDQDYDEEIKKLTSSILSGLKE